MNEKKDKANKERERIKEKEPKQNQNPFLLFPSIFLFPILSSSFATPTPMEVQCTPLGWPHFCQIEEMEELRHTLLYTRLELETTIMSAKEEIARREEEMIQMRDMLSKAIKERDEAQAQCQKLLILQQQNQETTPLSDSYTSELDDDTHDLSPKQPPPQLPQEVMELASKKPLPAKGKLLQAVMEAGPLLKTLLLAGPLPQWQHPPPKLEIPPISISSPTTSLVGLESCFTNKRGPMPLSHDCLPSSVKTRFT